jgi:Heparinase II/III-like protein/Domain of unknown function (DUF4962)
VLSGRVRATLVGAALVLSMCGVVAASSDGDWMSSIPFMQSSAPIRPPDDAHVQQTPPDFSWPDLGQGARYRLTLTYPDGGERHQDAPANWLNWSEVLPAGTFTWRVEATNTRGTRTSGSRRFTVDASAQPFVVPATDVLLRRATGKPHPRALPPHETLLEMLEGRRDGVAGLLRGVAMVENDDESDPVGDGEQAIESQAFPVIERALNALFAYVATGDDRHYAEALRRSLAIAAWDSRGRTSYAAADQVARGVAGTLVLAYDWLFPRLDERQKRQLLVPLQIRLRDMYSDLGGPQSRLAVNPYDSHGQHTLTFLAALATVLVGDVPEADAWLGGALPLALNALSPWGGEDGGFAGGTAYAQWTTGDQLLAWNILRWTVGVDVAQKAWTRNYSTYLAYFLPPGTPTGAFGDGAEQRLNEQWARFGKAFVQFAPTALGRWYAAQLDGEDPTRLHLLLAPLMEATPAPLPPDTPSSALFPSIGWAALHSDLADRGRLSIYFKSSPYGSFNHSHADQNGFVINAGGKALVIDSGYYDGYATPHWRDWYKQSRAHNVITFDGGRGQTVFEETARLGGGRIEYFEDRPEYSLVSGDATEAYGGALDKAQRSLVYLRPDLLLVHDVVNSSTPRRWEWNIHALEPIAALANGSLEIRNGQQRACVAMLAGPPTVFEQHARFTVPPLDRNAPPEFHGTFVATKSATTAEFVTLFSVGCRPTAPVAARTASGWTVLLSGYEVTFEHGGARVRAVGGEP